MRVAAILCVKDEEEMIKRNIEHLFTIKFSEVTVINIDSMDRTFEIVESCMAEFKNLYSKSIRDKDAHFYDQRSERSWFSTVRSVTAHAHARGAEWVCIIDADEFLLPLQGDIRKTAAFKSSDVVLIPRYNVPITKFGPLITSSLVPKEYDDIWVYTQPLNAAGVFSNTISGAPWISDIPKPKLIIRSSSIDSLQPSTYVAELNLNAAARKSIATDLLIAHVPLTSESRFYQKLENIRQINSVHIDDRLDLRLHWQRWLQLEERGMLSNELAISVLGLKNIDLLRKNGVISSVKSLMDGGFRDLCE